MNKKSILLVVVIVLVGIVIGTGVGFLLFSPDAELSIGQTSQPVFRDMRWGDPIMTSPSVKYVETIDGTEWYVLQDDAQTVFDGIFIDLGIQPLSYGYQNEKLVAIKYRVHEKYSKPLIDAFSEQYGDPIVYLVRHWDYRVWGTPSDLFYFEGKNVVATIFISDPWYYQYTSGYDIVIMTPSYWNEYLKDFYEVTDTTEVCSILVLDDPEKELQLRNNRTYLQLLNSIDRYSSYWPIEPGETYHPYLLGSKFGIGDPPYFYWAEFFDDWIESF